MMRMVHKYTRAAFALAIGWFLAYGISSATADCCSTLINTCATSGIRSSLTPTGDAHYRIAPSHYLKPHNTAGDGARSVLPCSEDTTTCCRQTPCFPIGTTVYLGNSPPASPWAQQDDTSCIIHCNHGNMRYIQSRHAFYVQSVQIYLMTKTIIC